MLARIAVVVTALVLAAPAGASIWPAPPPVSPHAVKFARLHAPARTHSCMAQQARAKIARWLLPVACEQPPRSQLLLVAPLFGGA
ncbi:MAG: hypothetical protein ACJ768_24130 [Gaiellaceae bacterium]